ncbi:unnamed protein product [Dovyalis caffra]|uniref:Uncharacterized protein n=1 Tax=Dovyalis caffra TaxID=77055 RepID=A0AAV1S9B5_9ROSI|nr:unnamed protein product [Dovyalis caffra]
MDGSISTNLFSRHPDDKVPNAYCSIGSPLVEITINELEIVELAAAEVVIMLEPRRRYGLHITLALEAEETPDQTVEHFLGINHKKEQGNSSVPKKPKT